MQNHAIITYMYNVHDTRFMAIFQVNLSKLASDCLHSVLYWSWWWWRWWWQLEL